ncbi:MAG: PIN domain-containing protein [Pseudomonadota bacterium]
MADAWFLDACVLVPQLPREILLGAAGARLLAPHWSGRVLEEWRIAAARRGGMAAERQAVARAADMAEAFPDALVAIDPGVESRFADFMPDRGDAHVAAGAMAAAARVITFNLGDFPVRKLGAEGLTVSHPDAALVDLLARHRAAMEGVVAIALAALDRPPQDRNAGRQALKRSGLPRFGKAWVAT